jgi:hypothetical protein
MNDYIISQEIFHQKLKYIFTKMNITRENLNKTNKFFCKMFTQFKFVTVRVKIHWINIDKTENMI